MSIINDQINLLVTAAAAASPISSLSGAAHSGAGFENRSVAAEAAAAAPTKWQDELWHLRIRLMAAIRKAALVYIIKNSLSVSLFLSISLGLVDLIAENSLPSRMVAAAAHD